MVYYSIYDYELTKSKNNPRKLETDINIYNFKKCFRNNILKILKAFSPFSCLDIGLSKFVFNIMKILTSAVHMYTLEVKVFHNTSDFSV